jgi:hypothetical protein
MSNKVQHIKRHRAAVSGVSIDAFLNRWVKLNWSDRVAQDLDIVSQFLEDSHTVVRFSLRICATDRARVNNCVHCSIVLGTLRVCVRQDRILEERSCIVEGMTRVVIIHARSIVIARTMGEGEEVPNSVWIVDTSSSRAITIVIGFVVVDVFPELSPLLVKEKGRTELTHGFLLEGSVLGTGLNIHQSNESQKHSDAHACGTGRHRLLRTEESNTLVVFHYGLNRYRYSTNVGPKGLLNSNLFSIYEWQVTQKIWLRKVKNVTTFV